jgi:signal transduction histidine kinase/CheY-like chemotaxis protein
MKRILIIAYSAFMIILLANFIYYKSLYNKQIKYIVELLDRQVQVIGLSVDNTNNGFLSDLNEISFMEDVVLFFHNPENRYRSSERLKLFFSKYQEFVTGIKLYDTNKNEFTLKRDNESKTGEWLEQTFVLHMQPEIFKMERLVQNNQRFEYYLPVLKNNEITGNIVVSVDYQKFFSEIFSEFNLKDYQWQWVVSDSGKIVYDNNGRKIEYSQLDHIISGITGGSVKNLVHNAVINNKKQEIISSYYPTRLLQRDLGLVFSAPTDFFQKYIIRNSLFIVLGTLLLIQVIICIFWLYIKRNNDEKQRLASSEKMLIKLIEEMPVGVIIHNKNREIIKANKIAANMYSFSNETDMIGKIFPETNVTGDYDYFSRNLAESFRPEKFVIIKKEIGELVLFRNSIPVTFAGEEADMEILIDVTMLESARKQEAKANVAKSEFLTRMSYEIRTPLNGIIGMTDILKKYEFSPEVSEIIRLLHRSTEVLLGIINDILDFSRIESGKMILDEVPFDPREEISYCMDLAKKNSSGREVILNCIVEDEVPESIIGDPFRLRQVLTNLLNHALRNTERGEILLKCMLKSHSDGMVRLGFHLLDTGISFDKASLKKIFGEFINIETKTFRNSEESGFGTILAKQLVELMGGELSVESPSGLSGELGTKVSFTINAYTNIKSAKELALERIKSLEEINTLIITGNQNRDEELLGILHKLKLNISVTSFLKSTVNQIRGNLNKSEGIYSLVIIFDDEDFNGFDAAKILWENGLSDKFIIIMISSNDKKGNYLRSTTLGIDYYLLKPFDISELLNVLKNCFPFVEDPSLSVDIGRVRTDVKILIVEDNKMNQKVIGTMLKNLGYSFDTADDGYSGYLKARSVKYDLIFMDLIMPEMDGYESANRILEFDKNILIAAFTADNLPESKRKAELAGIREFIPKPVRIDELKRLFAKYFMK